MHMAGSKGRGNAPRASGGAKACLWHGAGMETRPLPDEERSVSKWQPRPPHGLTRRAAAGRGFALQIKHIQNQEQSSPGPHPHKKASQTKKKGNWPL